MRTRNEGCLIAWLAAAWLCLSSAGFAADGAAASAPTRTRAGRPGAEQRKRGERKMEGATTRPMERGKAAMRPGAAAREEERQAEPAPTFADVSYGPDASNKIDFWKAQSATPAPLVVFIHGGGFRGGDKSKHDSSLMKACLDAGISYASINYRLSGVAPYPAQMHDCARAIQFIRSKAAEWNVDPKRVACTGGSAGAGISEWLAFHDDMADPKSDDPVARQSTRLTCAMPTQMQCTYDPREIKKIVPGNAYDVAPLKQLQGLPETFDWDKDPIDADLDARLRDVSPLTHLTKDDPPIFAMNSKGAETDGNIHHPNFGRYLKKQMDALGIECEFHLNTDFPDEQARVDAMMAFLKKNFGMK
ncbi:MAG: alpha/beta hydrolase [Candidatus Sumerlaeota bacterium]|nr:alpha/beta hydrolase [Candidatus Sumerlaeota bacterium]